MYRHGLGHTDHILSVSPSHDRGILKIDYSLPGGIYPTLKLIELQWQNFLSPKMLQILSIYSIIIPFYTKYI